MTVIDDKYLALRFSSQPEFLLRLDDFVACYRLSDKPALIVQARPGAAEAVEERWFDKQKFKQGIVTQTAWWDGFRSRVGQAACFHGTASLPGTDNPKWASEMHRDGHFIAGVWRFPTLPAGAGQVPVLAHFYATLFEHFATIVAQSLAASKLEPHYALTATLINAQELHFAREGDFGGNSVYPPWPKKYLQWPILSAKPGSDEWTSAAGALGAGLLGASGGEL